LVISIAVLLVGAPASQAEVRILPVKAHGLALAPNGNIYAAHQDVVQELTPAGEVVSTWGSHGTGDGQFGDSYGASDVVADPVTGSVYVADFGNERIQVFDAAHHFVDQFSTTAPPLRIDRDSSGNIYVAEPFDGSGSSAELEKFSATGQLLKSWPTGSDPGELNRPFDVAVAASDQVLVADGWNWRVQRFSAAGNYVSQFGSQGTGPGQFGYYPTGIDVAPDGAIYVANAERVEKFGGDGAFIARWTDPRGYIGVPIEDVLVAPGGNPVYLAFGSQGMVVLDHLQPTAVLAGPSRALTGRPVTFDASQSNVPFGAITEYEWDFDGDGDFETSTGAVASVSHAFARVGARTVRVRVTAPSGKTAIDGAVVDVARSSPPGPVGASIDNGAQFTNDPRVLLTVRWPAFTKEVVISNDGGFANARTFAVNSPLSWTLDSSGPERLPKTIYLRFDDGTQTFQDDIILDETAPVVKSASIAPSEQPAQSSLHAQAAPKYVLKIKASDNLSGVVKMQVAREGKPLPAWEQYRRSRPLGSPRAVWWVRVRDLAGNRSHWRRAKLP
jgi:DNA-binding beta-propeller fold protein YncE